MYHSQALDPIKSPVTKNDLADWLRLPDACDPSLDPMLTMATAQVIEYLQLELMNRARLTTWVDFPIVGTPTDGISHTNAQYKSLIELPYANLQIIEGVSVFGEVTDEYFAHAEQRPSLIEFQEFNFSISDDGEYALQVQYIAGFGDKSSDVPEEIKLGITCLAAYLYMHRGVCDMGSAIADSGAGALLSPYRVSTVIF